MATLQTSEQALIKAMDNLAGTYGKLSRSALGVTEALANTSDKFKKARIEQEVEKIAKKMGKSLDKADGGLLKFVKALNEQVRSYANVKASLKGLNSASSDSRKQFTASAQAYIKAAKENGQLQKALGRDYALFHNQIEQFLTDSTKSQGEVVAMAAVLRGYADKFGQEIKDTTDHLESLDKQFKKLSIKEALGDSLQKRGGIVGAITDSLRGPNGIASFINYLKAQSAEMLIGGVEKAVRQLIDASNTFYKTGVAPFVGASSRLLLQVTDLQNIMQANKETIFAMKGGAETFNATLTDLQTQTMKLAGMDPILSGKLGAAAMDLTTSLASTTLSTKELKARSKSYIEELTRMRRSTTMTAEQLVEMDNQILNDQEIREGLAKATVQERAQVLANIHRRVEEFQVMGLSIERSKQLAVSFEKLRRQATPVQRIRGAAQLGVLATQIGMSPEDTRQLMLLSRKKRDAKEEQQYEKLQIKFGQQYQKRFNELDSAGNPFADALQEMAGRAQEALPGLKAVFDTARVEGTITGGKARTDKEAQASLDINTGVQRAIVEAGHIASWVEKIYNWLSGNGLAGILLGSIGLLLTGGLGKIIGALGSLAGILIKSGTGTMGGASGAASRLGVIGAVGGLAIGAEEAYIAYKNKEQEEEINAKMAKILKTDTREDLQARLHSKGQLAYWEKPGYKAAAIEAPTNESSDTAPGSAAMGETGTSNPMEAMLVMQQQSKKILEQIAGGIETLVKTYSDTEAQKLQRLLTAPSSSLKAAREMRQ